MEPTVSTPMARKDLSEGMIRANNTEFNFNANAYLLNRKPDFWVYLYNVSEQSYEVSRPPLMHKVSIPAKKAGEPYAMVTRLPQPLLVPKGNVDSGEVELTPTDTRRFAMDIVNPENLTLDQDATIDPRSRVSQGNNLGEKGVFWSLNNPPTEEEIRKATQRMEKRYNFLLEQAKAVETSNPQALRDSLTPEHHTAADYFGLETSWHGKRVRPMDCPNCGEKIKQGAKFHKTDEGVLCIIDWQGAVAAGVRTRAQAYEATGEARFAPKVEEQGNKPLPTPKAPISHVPQEKA